jgi:hypothetical protein
MIPPGYLIAGGVQNQTQAQDHHRQMAYQWGEAIEIESNKTGRLRFQILSRHRRHKMGTGLLNKVKLYDPYRD